MALSFSELKKSRKSSLQELTKELTKMQSQEGRQEDDRFWKPGVDKAGNGMAIIRFLPAPKNEDVPFVKIFTHAFKGPTGQWYIENSLTTPRPGHSNGSDDPVSEYNSKLWNSTADDSSPARKQARDQKRKLNFISNIYVIKDPANPDNEGKVFLFKYGKKIFDKLASATKPEFDDETPISPFDLWEGADFKLKIRKADGYPNYDKSEFDSPKPLSEDDKVLQTIWEKTHSLQEFLEEKHFKSYDQLKTRLVKVLALDGSVVKERTKTAEDSLPWDEEAAPPPQQKAKAAPKQKAQSLDDDDDSETMNFFESLVDND